MNNKYLILSKTQYILFMSAMISCICQVTCIYFLLEKKNTFKFDKCVCYLIFSGLAFIFYYQLINDNL